MPQTILIFGFGPGISAAVAEKFGAAGFSVALIARNEQRLAAGVSALKAKGITAAAFPADAPDPAAIRAASGHRCLLAFRQSSRLSRSRGLNLLIYLTLGAGASKTFARAFVTSTQEGRTSFSDAFRLLGFKKIATFNELGHSLRRCQLFCTGSLGHVLISGRRLVNDDVNGVEFL